MFMTEGGREGGREGERERGRRERERERGVRGVKGVREGKGKKENLSISKFYLQKSRGINNQIN